MHRYLLITSLTLLAGITGCASKPADLQLTRTDSTRNFSADFARASVARSEDGVYDFIFSDGALEDAPAFTGKGPLPTTDSPPLRQVVHIRVLWRPLRGIRPNHPAATNASIDWYVIHQRPNAPVEVLHYAGVGFVSVYPNSRGARIYLSNAKLAMDWQRGQLSDPIGEASLTGAASAQTDPARVHQTLAELNDLALMARPAQTGLAPLPPSSRTPVEP